MQSIVKLEHPFDNLINDIIEKGDEWKEWYDKEKPE